MTIPEQICVILLIILAGLLIINTLRRVIKKEDFTPRDKAFPVIVFGASFLFVIVLAYRYSAEIELAELVQILLMFGLVTVTSVYAWSASRQANASVKMAEEMKELRLSEAQPYLLLRLKDEAIQWDEIENKRPPNEFGIEIRNVGKGPAINIWAALWDARKSFFGNSRGYLAPGENWETSITRTPIMLGNLTAQFLPNLSEIIEQHMPGIIAVSYNDVHKRIYMTYLYLCWHHSLDGYLMEGEQNMAEVNPND